jgi:hypothetical protein
MEEGVKRMINVDSMPELKEDEDELNTTYPTLGRAVKKPGPTTTQSEKDNNG